MLTHRTATLNKGATAYIIDVIPYKNYSGYWSCGMG